MERYDGEDYERDEMTAQEHKTARWDGEPRGQHTGNCEKKTNDSEGIWDKFVHLDEMLAVSQKALDELESRIHLVLKPKSPEPTEGEAGSRKLPEAIQSDMMGRMNSLNRQVNQYIERINDIRRRVQL